MSQLPPNNPSARCWDDLVETRAVYVRAIGGKLKIIGDFGGESYVLG